MAGKSSKGKGKGKSTNKVAPPDLATGVAGLASENVLSSPKPLQNPEVSKTPNSNEGRTSVTAAEGTTAATKGEEGETKDGDNGSLLEGEEELRLYPMTVKGPGGEQMELQVNPGDSVMDLRQFLLDAPETCFYTCYDLILSAADGVRYHLADYLEIGEVADVAAGGCTLEMVNAAYDDRSVRSHVRRTRDLISTASIHSSLSSALATEYEAKQGEGETLSSDSKSKSPTEKEAGAAKTEAPELEGLGFMEDTVGLLSGLVSSLLVLESNCVESIAFSSFNPVPGYRRLQGDLIYLDIVTAEGQSYCITAHTLGFYVNSSKGSVLDTHSRKQGAEAPTLVGILRKLSDKFMKGFAEVLEKKSAGHPFESVPVLLPPNPWLGVYPPPAHRRDIARAEDSLMVPYGTEVIGMQRDWNEELQSCREFPRETLQDRIMRDRALYKVNCDFVDAATKGAKAVIGRCIPPINPTDPDRFHMYVHNNIFFSFAVDGDFAFMQQLREQELLQQTEGGAGVIGDEKTASDVVTNPESGEASVEKHIPELLSKASDAAGEKVSGIPTEEAVEATTEEVAGPSVKGVVETLMEEVVQPPTEEAAEAHMGEVVEAPTEKVEESLTESPADEVREALTGTSMEEVAGAPAEEVSGTPTDEVAEAPMEEAAEAPTEEPAEAPVEEVTQTPKGEVAEARVEEVAEAPAEEVAEVPAEEVAEVPAEEVAEAPTEGVAEAPIEEFVKAATDEVAEVAIEEVVEAPAEKVAEAPVVEVAEAPTGKVVEAPAKQVTEAPGIEVVNTSVEEVVVIEASEDLKEILEISNEESDLKISDLTVETSVAESTVIPSKDGKEESKDGKKESKDGKEESKDGKEESKDGKEESKDGNTSAPVVESEQATYASSNNDLKGTKAYNNADVGGLYTLAMGIIDYRGHRVVAQSIIPGILQGDKTDSLLYGSVDNGKKISWNEKFHAKVLEAGKLLHIKEHEVVDGSGNKIKLCAPVECKGIVGSDDRHYMLDLMRTTPRDANYTGLGSRLCVLRPELVTAFCQVEALERAKKRKADVGEADEKTLLLEELPLVVLNPNVFTDFKVAGKAEEVAADEDIVRKAAEYLVDTVLPKLVQDLSSLEVSPMDGHTLTEALHVHGINVRYLGKVAKLSKHLPHIWDLCVVEMVVRSAKHVLKGVLRETLDQDVGGAIAHFYNCLVGLEAESNPPADPRAEKKSSVGKGEEGSPVKSPDANGKVSSGKKKHKKQQDKGNSTSATGPGMEHGKKVGNGVGNEKGLENRPSPSYLCITAKLVWIDIRECVKFKYQFELPEDIRSKVCRISTIRDLCQKVGVTLAARDYHFDLKTPFQISDILDLQAVVKHSTPVCSDARDLLESGKVRLALGKLNEAYELFSEAFTILQQVCGPMHREVANCCRYLAMVLYHAGDMAGAIMQQHKELIINERCLGPDHPDTAHSYGNMALFYHGLNQTELALRHMSRTLMLLNVSCGSDHPDVAATFINIAMMYQDIGRMHVALRYLQEALKRNERLLGPEHIQTAVCYHALAIAFNCMGAYKLSLQHERSTYNILLKQLGEEDARTKDSANWIKTFQIRDLQANAQKQRGQQSATIIAAAKAAEALKARSDLVQAFQAAAGGGPTGRAGISKAAAAAALIGDGVPRPRGQDERTARATAEVRKKAAARGLNIRPQASVLPGQAMPPLGELLSLFNGSKGTQARSAPGSSSSKGTAAKEVASVSEGKKVPTDTPRSSSDIPSKSSEATTLDSESGETVEKAPLGLGGGLGGLEVKKRKPRSKNPT